MKLAPGYSPSIKLAVIQQSVVLLLASLMLDFGQTLHACCVAALAHWATIALIITRRPSSPTPLDITLVRYGFWVMAFLMWMVAPLVWKLSSRM
jgi:hypothetical protein